jgi:hypothetical protein
MPQYTVQDTETGRTVTFDWAGAEAPTDADMAEVFAAARDQAPAEDADPSMWDRVKDAAYKTSPARIFDKENLPSTLAAVGAGLGTAATGGLALPVILAAAGGSMGAGINASRENRMPGMGEIALEGGIQGAATLAGGGAAKAAAWAGKNIGRKMMGGALKIDRGYLKKMAQAEPGESMIQKEQRLVDRALDADGNVLTHKGANRLQDTLDEVSVRRDSAIAGAPQTPVPGSGRRIESGIVASANDETGLTPQDNLRQISRVVRQVQANPRVNTNVAGLVPPGAAPPPRGVRDLTPNELATVIEGTNRNLQGLFGDTSAAAGARAKALKGGVGAARDALEDAVPESRTLGREMRDLIDLRNVSQLAQARSNNQNLIGLTDVISLSAGRPAVLAASIAQRAPIASMIGRGAWRGGKVAARQDTPKRRLLAMLLGQQADSVIRPDD